VAPRDPLANPLPLLRRVHAYVAYRIGPGPEAEDVTGETFARAVRYRESYDAAKGDPLSWLIGIASRCVDDAVAQRRPEVGEPPPAPADGELEHRTIEVLTLKTALRRLPPRDRELIALRYGADLTTRELASQLDLEPNAAGVALHRALARLRELLEPTNRL
jgi:RNA polymerase sigma factor (sigma-70 family)